MKKLIILLSFFISSNLLVFGQEKPAFEMRVKSAIYFEIFGNSASVSSLNYDRIVKQYKNGYFNASFGFASYEFSDFLFEHGYNIPVSLNYSVGRKNGHFEAGIGFGLNRGIDKRANMDFMRLLLTGRMGYKYQKPSGGLFFKAGITPIGPVYYFKGTHQTGGFSGLELLFNVFSLCAGISF